MSNPLFETLFRPTTLTAHGASAPPVRAAGTRTRAGNAMNRTRAALLAGAAKAVAAHGTKITMAEVAACSGVAKATLYNHFRTREAVLAALVVDQVDAVIAAHADEPLADALTGAAARLSVHPVLRGLATGESATLAALARIDPTAEGWQHARGAVAQALAAAGRGGTDTVLRWLASFVITPARADVIAVDVAALLTGLPSASPGEPAVVRPA